MQHPARTRPELRHNLGLALGEVTLEQALGVYRHTYPIMAALP
jgi:hypothetical protein